MLIAFFSYRYWTCSPAFHTGRQALHHELRHRRYVWLHAVVLTVWPWNDAMFNMYDSSTCVGGFRGEPGRSGREDEANKPGFGTAAHAWRYCALDTRGLFRAMCQACLVRMTMFFCGWGVHVTYFSLQISTIYMFLFSQDFDNVKGKVSIVSSTLLTFVCP